MLIDAGEFPDNTPLDTAFLSRGVWLTFESPTIDGSITNSTPPMLALELDTIEVTRPEADIESVRLYGTSRGAFGGGARFANLRFNSCQ